MEAGIQIFKPKIGIFSVFIALLSYLMGGGYSVGTALLLSISGFLASSGAAALNNYFDVDIDTLMNRTKSRPLPRGLVRPETALFSGCLLVASGIAVAAMINFATAFFALLGAFIYVGIYTILLKRRSWTSVVVGGWAGSCAVLAGFAAAESELSTLALAMSFLVFLWTPSHFWSFALAHKRDYMRAGVPMLPAVVDNVRARKYIALSTYVLVGFSIILFLYFTELGVFYLLLSASGGAVMIYLSRLLLRSTDYAIKNYRFSDIYLGLVFLGATIDVLAIF